MPHRTRLIRRRLATPWSVLKAALGRWQATLVLAGLAKRHLMERPFAALPAATDRRERLSRKQALGAILLYRELKARIDDAKALEITSGAIEAGAVAHLRKTLGNLKGDALARLEPKEREDRVRGWMDRFFTATTRLDEVSASKVSFTVTACALVRLSHAAGHPELAPAFCRGDASYFSSLDPPIHLDRATTIALGGETCPFRLRLDSDEVL